MKALFWWGLVCVVLGVLSFFITFPQAQPQAFQSDRINLGGSQVQQRPMPGLLGGVLIAGGLGIMVAGCRDRL